MTAPEGCVVAVTPAGQLDTTFNGGAGYVLVDPSGTNESGFSDVVVQTQTIDGQPVRRVVAAGYTMTPYGGTSYATGYLAAYTSSGAPDTTFGTGGSITYANPPGAYSFLRSLALEGDGSIVAGGSTANEMLIGRVTPSGAADITFGPNGTGFTVVQDGLSSGAWGLAIDPTDGGVLAAGFSNSTAHSPVQAAVVRLTAR
jgi:uncharacterized delta-60 repeat protein